MELANQIRTGTGPLLGSNFTRFLQKPELQDETPELHHENPEMQHENSEMHHENLELHLENPES